MKKPLVVILLLCCMGNVFAQQILDTASIKCQYSYILQKDTINLKTIDDLLVLQIGRNISKCYSYYTNQIDSLDSTPEGKKELSRMTDKVFQEAIKTHDISILQKGHHKRMKAYIYKNYPVGKITVTDGLVAQDYIYLDSLNTQNWQIKDSTKVILNDTCQMAECDFRGRHWTAWFAPGIPIGNGPWKLGGLPGLILEAYERGNQYHFTATGLEKCHEPIFFSQTYVGSNTFEKTDRITFLKAQKDYFTNMLGSIQAETGIDLSNGEPEKTIQFDLLELDYKDKK